MASKDVSLIRSRGWLHLLAVVGIVVPGMNGWQRPLQATLTPQACENSLAARKKLRVHDGQLVFVDAPAVRLVGRRNVVVGWPAYSFPEHWNAETPPTDVTAAAGALLDQTNDVEVLPLPPATPEIPLPRVASTSGESFEMVWMGAANEGAGTLKWSRWTANRWSAPKAVEGTIDASMWRPLLVSQPVMIEGKPTLLATPGLDSRTIPRMLERRLNGWFATKLSGVYQLYPSLAPSGDSSRISSYVDFGAPDGNAVYVRRSGNRGSSWNEPLRISPAGLGQAYDPVLLDLGAGTVAVAWFSELSTRGSTVNLALSTDLGVTWKQQPPFPIAKTIVSLRALADARRNIHMVIQLASTMRNDVFTPAYVEWRDSTWSTFLTAPDSVRSIGIAGLGPTSDGGVLLVWGEPAPSFGPNVAVTAFVRIPSGGCNLPPRRSPAS